MSSDKRFAFLHFFFLGMVLITASCTMSWTYIHSSSWVMLESSYKPWSTGKGNGKPLQYSCGVGEDSWESLGLQPVHPKGDKSWVLIGRTDVEAKTPILLPPDAKSWLIGKDPYAGKDWGKEENGTTEDEMLGQHHWLDGHGFGWTPELVRDREAWHAAVHGVAKNQTWLSDWCGLILNPMNSMKSQEIPGVTGKFSLEVQNETRQWLTQLCQENAQLIANTLFWEHKTTLHMDIIRWSTPKSDWLYSL